MLSGKDDCRMGSPHSGKNVFSVKLSKCIYDTYNCSVIHLSCDYTSPTLPVLFPHYKSSDLHSIGSVLEKAEIQKKDALKNMVTVKNMKNFCFAGYVDGENGVYRRKSRTASGGFTAACGHRSGGLFK